MPYESCDLISPPDQEPSLIKTSLININLSKATAMASNPKQSGQFKSCSCKPISTPNVFSVNVLLEVVNDVPGELHQTRAIKLDTSNNYTVRIGRGSRSGGKDLYPSDSNAWFESRVMSREHAILRAEPSSKVSSTKPDGSPKADTLQKIYLEDVGSMHGTYVEGTKLQRRQPKLVPSGTELRFGAEVSRGPGKLRKQWRLDLSHLIVLTDPPETFPALQIDINYDFEDNSNENTNLNKTSPADVIMWSSCGGDVEDAGQRAPSHISRNSFSVPDYDSVSEDYDSEVEQPLREATRKVEVVIPSRNAAVPESDFSNGSVMSDDDDDATTPYEPWNRSYCSTFESSEARNNRLSVDHKKDPKKAQDTPEKESVCQTSPSANIGTSQHLEMQSSMTVMPTQPPVLQGPTQYFLTDEEESDYGDDVSADLFDDGLGFEDYRKSGPQPDNSSFSSQSPVLTSLPSKIQLAAGPEPAKSAVAVAAKTQSNQVPKNDEPRAPSPSDAAMPKAKATTYTFKNPVYAAEPDAGSYGGYNNPRNSDWSGYGAEYPVSDRYRQAYSNATDYWSTPQPPYYYSYSPVGAASNPWGYPTPAVKPVESAPKPLEPVPAPTLTSSFVTLKATPRVAIKDLVDEPQSVGEPVKFVGAHDIASQSISWTRLPELRTSKRKADEISDVDMPASIPATSTASLAEEQDAQLVDAVASTTDSHSQTDSLQPINKGDEARAKVQWPESSRHALADALVKSLKSNSQNEGLAISNAVVLEMLDGNPAYLELCKSFESRGFKFDRGGLAKSLMNYVPALKVSKSSPSSMSASAPTPAEVPGNVEVERPRKKACSSFYKYAATAAGGIAVGAMGAVAALVALPSDFFV